MFQKPLIIKLLSALLHIVVCLIAAIVIIYLKNGFGKGDIYPFVFWTVPLTVGIAFNGRAVLNLCRSNHFLLRLVFITIIAGLLSLTWIYSVALILGPWIGTFSIPLFYIWIGGNMTQLLFLDWRLPRTANNQKSPKAVVSSLFSFLITLIVTTVIILLFNILNAYLSQPDKETYLIPVGFEGEVTVIYGEKCGIKPAYENGRRVLQIPDNGILIIQPEFEGGTFDREYYFIDRNGKKERIKLFWADKKRTINSPSGVLSGGAGSMPITMSDGSSLAIRYTHFTVFNKGSILEEEGKNFRHHEQLDSLAPVIIKTCREKKANSNL